MKSTSKYKQLLAFIFIFLSSTAFASIEKIKGGYIVSGDDYVLGFSKKGELEYIETDGKSISVSSGNSVCSIVMDDNNTYDSKNAKFQGSGVDGNTLYFDYEFQSRANVRVLIQSYPDYVDFSGKVLVEKGTVTQVSILGKLIFNPEDLNKITTQTDWPRNMGLELNSSFFVPRNNINANIDSYQRGEPNNGKPHRILYGEPGRFAATEIPAKLKKGKDAQSWLGNDAENFIARINASADRPMDQKFADINVIESENGIFLGGTRFGGSGALLRMGGFVKGSFEYVSGVIGELVKRVYAKTSENPSPRKKVAIIDYNRDGFRSRIQRIRMEFMSYQNDTARLSLFTTLKTPEELERAMNDPSILMIVNPYEEVCPSIDGKPLNEFVLDIKDFVKGGGYWFETGGYPFYFELEKSKYLQMRGGFIADFTHFDMKSMQFALYSVQPVHEKDFNQDIPFTKIYVNFSGTDAGCEVRRDMSMWIPVNKETYTPKTRIRFKKDAISSANVFCQDNKIRLKLSEKVSPDFLEKFRKSPIIRIDGANVEYAERWFEEMPVPAIIHCSFFVYGGFDQQYPDILPPNKRYSPSEYSFKSYLNRIQEKGSMFMPYTNNTWWCDNPKGPSFTKYGYDALVRNKNGDLIPERYADHVGYTTCMWHPNVRTIDNELFDRFKTEYPADIIFQDQIGSRSESVLDFNTANPQSPNSYLDGIIYSAMENSKNMPLSTEDLFSPLIDYEIQTCGFGFGIFHPRRPGNLVNSDWRFVWETWPKDAVKLCNVVGALAHDKLSISHQNLDGDIFNYRQLSMSLAYGIHLIVSGGGHASPLFTKEYIEWIHWVHSIQQAISSRYIGAEMRDFNQEWVDTNANNGDCILSATYGDVSIFSNATSSAREYDRFTLAPDGFIAKAPNAMAGGITSVNGETISTASWFVVEKSDESLSIGIYGNSGNEVIVPVEDRVLKLVYNKKEIPFTQKNGVLSFPLPDSKKAYTSFYKFTCQYEK